MLTPSENNNFLTFKIILITIIILTAIASGCIDFKKKEQQPQQQQNPNTYNKPPSDQDKKKEPPLILPPKIETKKVMTRPYICNNELIIEQARKVFGEEYQVIKAALKPGTTYANANCFIRKIDDNLNQNTIAFNIMEMPDNEKAIEKIENEKNKWLAQFSNSKKEDNPLGNNSYTLINETENQIIYNIIAIDPDMQTVYIEAKNIMPIEKEKLIEFVKAIEEII
jgi:hypothetical protein